MKCNHVTRTSIIRKISYIFRNEKKKLKTKKNENIYMDSKKSMNLFERNKRIGCLIIYWIFYFQFVTRIAQNIRTILQEYFEYYMVES